MTEPEITVRKLKAWINVELLGTDEQGRRQYRCPSTWCGETAYFDEDGRGHCPSCEAMQTFLFEAVGRLDDL